MESTCGQEVALRKKQKTTKKSTETPKVEGPIQKPPQPSPTHCSHQLRTPSGNAAQKTPKPGEEQAVLAVFSTTAPGESGS